MNINNFNSLSFEPNDFIKTCEQINQASELEIGLMGKAQVKKINDYLHSNIARLVTDVSSKALKKLDGYLLANKSMQDYMISFKDASDDDFEGDVLENSSNLCQIIISAGKSELKGLIEDKRKEIIDYLNKQQAALAESDAKKEVFLTALNVLKDFEEYEQLVNNYKRCKEDQKLGRQILIKRSIGRFFSAKVSSQELSTYDKAKETLEKSLQNDPEHFTPYNDYLSTLLKASNYTPLQIQVDTQKNKIKQYFLDSKQSGHVTPLKRKLASDRFKSYINSIIKERSAVQKYEDKSNLYLGGGICAGSALNYALEKLHGVTSEFKPNSVNRFRQAQFILGRTMPTIQRMRSSLIKEGQQEIKEKQINKIQRQVFRDDIRSGISDNNLFLESSVSKKLDVVEQQVKGCKNLKVDQFFAKLTEMKQSKELPCNCILTIASSLDIKGRSSRRHAIYLSLQSPYELRDINYPNLDFKSNDFEEFKLMLLAWFTLNSYENIRNMIEIKLKSSISNSNSNSNSN
ncbi:MAG: hypothetical protein K0S74_1440 [Chlamydiales bacterium]|jgi:hypothetical protein|nr:hypothetical protein [Chlamydiales bacterium]